MQSPLLYDSNQSIPTGIQGNKFLELLDWKCVEKSKIVLSCEKRTFVYQVVNI